jgi:glycerophosphoryl diester phosphodiesterase
MRRPSKQALLGVVAAVGLAVLWYLFLHEPAYHGLITVPRPGRTLIFGHRGFGNYAPDNSLAGALLAMQAGMDGVDMDGQLSADGVLVIFHDLSVDRLTNATGKVTSKTLRELLALDLAPKYGHGFKNAFVATFEDFVQRLKGKGILMVELKVPGLKDTGIERQAVSIIQKYHAQDSVYLSSFNPVVLYRVKHLDPTIRTVYIFMDTNWNKQLLAEIKPEDLVNLPWVLRKEFFRRAVRKFVHPDLLSVNYQVDPRTIGGLLDAGYPIFLWTPEEERDLRWALAQRPYGVISDEPQFAQRLRDSSTSAR